MTLWVLFQTFLSDALDAALNEILTALEGVMGNLLYAAFFIESLPGLNDTVLTEGSIAKAYRVLYGFMVLILSVKLIWKGIRVYVLWRDGDADTPPQEMLLGAAYAIIVAVAFPLLYEIGVEVVNDILTAVSQAVFSEGDLWANNFIRIVLDAFMNISSLGFLVILLGLVYVILFLIVLFTMLKQGAEMLAYRLGVPIAVAGLIDSDGGSWKAYSQALFRQMATALLRHFFMYLGVRLIAGLSVMGLILGITFEIVAICMPTILSQFLTPKNGGGFTQKIYSVGMAARFLKG